LDSDAWGIFGENQFAKMLHLFRLMHFLYEKQAPLFSKMLHRLPPGRFPFHVGSKPLMDFLF